jgi:ubiquinone/menaquinone biosynthesis C-methylase UbiE
MSKTAQLTKEWEEAYIHTRRGVRGRTSRIRMFGMKNSDKVLDLGCGDGLNISILRKMGIDKTFGVDPLGRLINITKKNNPGVIAKIGTAEHIPFRSESFDIVLVDSVFHHLTEYVKPVKEIKRILKKGGYLCFIEPHGSVIRTFIDWLTARRIAKFAPIISARRTTYMEAKILTDRWLNAENAFSAFLEKNGFKKIFRKINFLSVIGKYERLS